MRDQDDELIRLRQFTQAKVMASQQVVNHTRHLVEQTAKTIEEQRQRIQQQAAELAEIKLHIKRIEDGA